MANTFTLIGTMVSSGTGTFGFTSTPTFAHAFATPSDGSYAYGLGNGAGITFIVRSDTTTHSYTLAGDAAGTYAFGSLPTGFIPTVVRLNYGGDTGFGAIGDTVAQVNANCTYRVEFDTGTFQILTKDAVTNPFGVNPASPYIDPRFPGATAATLNSGGYGFRFTNGGPRVENFALDELTVTGSYVILTITSTTGGSPSASPAHGPLAGGTTFTIAGTGFSAGTPTVKVDGVLATGVVVDSDIQITCVSPAASIGGTKDVTVTIAGTTVTDGTGFTYDSSVWYYNSVSNHYKLAAVDPGPPWTPVTPTITTPFAAPIITTPFVIFPIKGNPAGGD